VPQSVAGLGHGERALRQLSATLVDNPSSAWANGVKGIILVTLGQRPAGRASLLTALRLNPRDSSAGLFPGWITISCYYDGSYAQAVALAKTMNEHFSGYTVMYRWLAAALGQLGHTDDARAALEKAVLVSPKSFELHVLSRPAWIRPEDHEHML